MGDDRSEQVKEFFEAALLLPVEKRKALQCFYLEEPGVGELLDLYRPIIFIPQSSPMRI